MKEPFKLKSATKQEFVKVAAAVVEHGMLFCVSRFSSFLLI